MQIGEQEIIAEQNEPTFETLINALCPVLENLYHNKHQLFQALMYKIDISEKMLNNAIEKPGKDLLKEVAVLVVKRELQKTISRNFYKKQH